MLWNHAMKIIDCEKEKEMISLSLTMEEIQSHHEQSICHICKKEFRTNNNKCYKVRDPCHYTGKYKGAAYNICNLRSKTPEEIPVVFHNSCKFDYHFIIKDLAEELKRQFKCLGENTENYITFSVSV